MIKSTEDRLRREKDFHNKTFSSDSRKAVKKYYMSANISKEFYKSMLLEGIKAKKVLEYGCGPGSSAFDIARAGGEVNAIDISDVAIKQTLEKANNYSLQISASVMDAENLSFSNDSFDLVCGSGILHHLNLNRSYREIQRVLKKNGKAIFFEPLGHNPIINLYRYLTPKMRTDDEHPLLMSDLKLAENYFGDVSINYFNFTSIIGAFFPPIVPFLNHLDELLFKKLPYLRKYAWIVVIEFSNPK